MKQSITISMLVAVALLFLSGCHSTPQFTVTGHVTDADNQTLYFEHVALEGTHVLDSVVLHANGRFDFKHPVPEYPDFYRLRLGKQTIPFPIDTVSNLSINADAQNFATSYSIEGSTEAAQMKDIWLAQLDANVTVSSLITRYNQGEITMNDLMEGQQQAVNEYKSLANAYIFNSPKSPVAYFALFQQVGGALIYNIYDKEDSRSFAIIANVYEAFYPENKRTKHLYDLALKSIQVVRAQERRERVAMDNDSLVHPVQPKVVGYVDFTLPDLHGNELTLSQVAQGSYTLLSFTTMSAEWSLQYTTELQRIYDAFASKGLKIFQVGFDADSHIWRTAVQRQPWINVRDREGGYSQLIGFYNIISLPTLFIIDKKGDILQRVKSIDELQAWLHRNL